MKLLGIDYGDSKVGLAIGDTESGLALPYKILKNTGSKKLISDIDAICREERIVKVVVGIPTNTQVKKITPSEVKVQDFIDELGQTINLPLQKQSEIFTTKAAQKLSGGNRDDDLAAMLILQSYLDAL